MKASIVERMNVMKNSGKTILLILLLSSVMLTGCGSDKDNNSCSKEAAPVMDMPEEGLTVEDQGPADETEDVLEEYYRKKFENYRNKVALSPAACDIDTSGCEEYKKSYWLLIHDLLNWGFSLDGSSYPESGTDRDGFQFSLLDLNDDGTPELLLGYGYNGYSPYSWHIFKVGNSYGESYVGKISHFDRVNSVCLDGDLIDQATGYRFDGKRLDYIFDYNAAYVEYDGEMGSGTDEKHYYHYGPDISFEEISEEEYKEALSPYENTDTEITGEILTLDNFAAALEIDPDSWKKEAACRSYLAWLKHYTENKHDMDDLNYSLVNIDGDGIPEVLAFEEYDISLLCFRDGRVSFRTYYISNPPEYSEAESKKFLYLGKGVLSLYSASWGHTIEDFYVFTGNDLLPLLTVRKEPLSSIGFSNSHQRDFRGNTLYDYYLDEEIASKDDLMTVVGVLVEVFDIGDGLLFEELENYSLQDFMELLKDGGSSDS